MERKGFKEGFLAELKNRCNILNIASKYLEIVKKGSKYWARCPFHFEKTPSFVIDEYNGFYKCFGCGESGDVITLVQKMEGLDFLGAIEYLAKEVGMEIAYEHGSDMQDIAKRQKEKNLVLKALNDVKDYYVKVLYEPKAKIAQDYIKQRKLNKASLEKFEFGYCNDFNSSINYLKSHGHTEKTLFDAGITAESNGRYYDTQAERLVFPIYNTIGQVVAFSGRILVKNDEIAKYKNSKQTIVFDKSATIYGLKQAVASKREERFDSLMLVEGQLDVIMLHQHGFTNAIASLGTALTEQHATIIKKVCNTVYVCYDGDTAGRKATLRAIDILAKAGLEIRVVNLPAGMDPDEYLKAYGEAKLRELILAAEEAMNYKIRVLAESKNMKSNFEKTAFIKAAIELISVLPTAAEREVYLGQVRKYCDVHSDVLRETLSQMLSGKAGKAAVGAAPMAQAVSERESKFRDANLKSDRFVLAALLHNCEFARDIDCAQLEFINPVHKKLSEKIALAKASGKSYKVSNIFDDFDIETESEVQEIIDFTFNENNEINAKELNSMRNINEKRALEIRKEKLIERNKQTTNKDERMKILSEIQEIAKKLEEKKSSLIN